MLPLRKLTFLTAALLIGTLPLEATTKPPAKLPPNLVDASAGVLSLDLEPNFVSMSAGAGVILTNHGTCAIPAGVPAGSRGFRIYSGEVDLNYGLGDFESVGSLQLANNTVTVTLRHFTFDNTGLTPVVSAEILINGYISGRYAVFTLDPAGAYPFESTPTSFTMGQVPMVLSDTFVSYINSIFNAKVYNVGTAAGSVFVNATMGSGS